MTADTHSESGRWPYWMRAETAAAYCDEKSKDAFLRCCGPGEIYPAGEQVEGKGLRWRRADLEAAIDRKIQSAEAAAARQRPVPVKLVRPAQGGGDWRL